MSSTPSIIAAALAGSHARISGPSEAAAKLGGPRQTLEATIQRLGIDKYGPTFKYRHTPCPLALLAGRLLAEREKPRFRRLRQATIEPVYPWACEVNSVMNQLSTSRYQC